MFYFKIDGVSPNSGKGTVYCIYRNGTQVSKSTGVTVNPKHFNTSTGKVSGKDGFHPEKNAKIQAVAAAFQLACRDLQSLGERVTRAAIDRQIEVTASLNQYHDNMLDVGRDVITLREARVELLESELEELRIQIKSHKWILNSQLPKRQQFQHMISDSQQRLAALDAEATEIRENIAAWEVEAGLVSSPTFAEKLDEYCKIKLLNTSMQLQTVGNYKLITTAVNNFKPRLQMKEMNLAFFQEFQAHLMARGVTNNSIRGMISRIKGIYKYFADDLNLPTGFFSKFEQVPATTDKNVVFLSPEELAELEALPLTARVHREVRQQFLFAVETGLRRSDYNITAANIRGREFVVTTQKTSTQVNIPATDKALRLFNEAGQSFRLIPESQFNQTLRLICQKMPSMQEESIKTLQIGKKVTQKTFKKWQRMTSHVARKTFVENAVAKGIELIAIAEWLGHSDTQMLQKHYAHKGQIAKREAHKLLV